MGKGAVRRPSFLSPGPTAVRAFFFSFPSSGLSGLCRRSAGLLRGRIPGRAPLRLQFSCASLSPVSVHPSVSCLRAHISLYAPLRPAAFPCRTDGGLHLPPPLCPAAFPCRTDWGRTSRRLSVQPPFRVEPTMGCTSCRPAIREMNGHTPSGSRRLSIQPFVLFRNCFWQSFVSSRNFHFRARVSIKERISLHFFQSTASRRRNALAPFSINSCVCGLFGISNDTVISAVYFHFCAGIG